MLRSPSCRILPSNIKSPSKQVGLNNIDPRSPQNGFHDDPGERRRILHHNLFPREPWCDRSRSWRSGRRDQSRFWGWEKLRRARDGLYPRKTWRNGTSQMLFQKEIKDLFSLSDPFELRLFLFCLKKNLSLI